MVGGTGLEPVAPTTSSEFSQVQRVNSESTGVSGSLNFAPPIKRPKASRRRTDYATHSFLRQAEQPTFSWPREAGADIRLPGLCVENILNACIVSSSQQERW